MNSFSLVLIIAFGIAASKLYSPKGKIESVLFLYVSVSFLVITIGFIASYFNSFDKMSVWISFQIIFLVSLIPFVFIRKISIGTPNNYPIKKVLDLNPFEKFILCLLSATILSVLVLNAFSIFNSAPHNTDSLNYHLARVAFYLQHGTMDWYPANQWPQVVHPKNSASIFGYIFLVSNYSENLTQIPQFFAYIITILSVYGICLHLNINRLYSIFSALISGLPICLILGSTTTQNDLIITSFAGCAVYFVLNYKNSNELKYIGLFIMSVSVMSGFKASSIMIYPVLGITFIYCVFKNLNSISLKVIFYTFIFIFLAVVLIILPSGYWENLNIYGNPIGPDAMRKEHNFEGLSFLEILYEGLKNVFRYLANFICFDGLVDAPRFVYGANTWAWKGITWLFEHVWPDIYTNVHMRLPFGNYKKITSDEESVFFGPIGFLMIWPLVLWGFIYSILNIKKPISKTIFFLSGSCFVFLFSQSFFGQFDPWRGRMFGTLVLFAAPICGIWWGINKNNLLSKIYLFLVLTISCWAAIWSILFRYDSSWIKPNYTSKTLFKMNRMEQLMRDLPYDYQPYRKFDEIVPLNSKVNSWLMGSYPEYTLFGKGLTRKIYTREESLNNGIKADYLIFDSTQFDRRSTDISLGNGLQLRKLD